MQCKCLKCSTNRAESRPLLNPWAFVGGGGREYSSHASPSRSPGRREDDVCLHDRGSLPRGGASAVRGGGGNSGRARLDWIDSEIARFTLLSRSPGPFPILPTSPSWPLAAHARGHPWALSLCPPARDHLSPCTPLSSLHAPLLPPPPVIASPHRSPSHRTHRHTRKAASPPPPTLTVHHAAPLPPPAVDHATAFPVLHALGHGRYVHLG